MATFNVRPDIDAAAAKLGSTLGAGREIKRLPEVLWEGEKVEMLATGIYGKGNGLLAMTDLRLIFLKHGITSQQVEDFPYSKITSVQWAGGILAGTLIVFASGNRAEIKQVPKQVGKDFADKLRMYIATGSAPGAPDVPAAAPTPQQQDPASRLATLDQLRAAGAITDQEYQDRRKAIIDSI
ncbi:PH domain-containing protein [Streptomyces odonnellii]|uniref:PH domain-containing protein n=1 Tax=Streptomyces odonnellii TaxID=1417980 RepID=UPI000625AB7C|nr:PH domain-containing protein [Streptomyces odonnellii]